MKASKGNTVQAEGYENENIRECPVCHGSGLTTINTTNNPSDMGSERDCPQCGGRGVISLDEK